MKIKISREVLLPVLQAANNVVERRQTLPILSNVLVEGLADAVRITSTDMEVELCAEVTDVETDTGAAALPARKLLDICRALPVGSAITIDTDGNKAKLTSGRSKFSLAAMRGDEFPSVGNFSTQVDFSLDRQVLVDLVESTLFAMAHQDVRYYLNGLLLEIDGHRVRAVATDGHRLALCEKELAVDLGGESKQYIIPRKGVLELARLLSNGDGEVQLSIGENHLRATLGSVTLISKLVDGRFPDYDRVIPGESEFQVVAQREDLRSGLGRASILSNEKFRGVRLTFKKELLVAVAHNPEQEEAEEEMEIQYAGDGIEVGFNVSYLLDVLGVIRAEQVRIDLVDAQSSALIRAVGDDSARYVVMPMRL